VYLVGFIIRIDTCYFRIPAYVFVPKRSPTYFSVWVPFTCVIGRDKLLVLSVQTYQVAIYDTVLLPYTSQAFSALKKLLSSLIGLRLLSYANAPNF